MTPERFQLVEALFHEALELPLPARAAFLDERCGADRELRAEVESLLAEDSLAENTIANAVFSAAADYQAAEAEAESGRMIGNYRVIREIGRGGMGAVLQAVRADDQYLQSVAIKVLPRGVESAFLRSRFLAERQILATLQHPNIAALLDGGATPDGRPYLVMEFIEGEPITAHCRNRSLGIQERLELFRSVCGAVHSAHQKLVIHRDIKPANVLVTAEGVPKLLDFGIAKLLAPELIPGEMPRTMTEVRLMTPEYASPEQVRGDVLTTSTDIYSLGVLLYELLTEARAYKVTAQSQRAVETAVLEQDPPPPSAAAATPKLRRQIAGDLDRIVAKAMHKDTARRYQSAEQLAEDIGRYLRGETVSARPDTLIYRTTKLVRRNPLAFGALALLVLSLGAGLAATMYQARRAERRFAQVRKLANSFLFDFHDKIQHLAGSTEARAFVVKTGLEYLDSLAAESGTDVSLKAELAEAYARVANVQGGVRGANLGQVEQAMASYRKAIRLAEEIGPSSRTPAHLRLLSDAYGSLGDLENAQGRPAEGLAYARRAAEFAAQAAGGSDKPEDRLFLAQSHTRLGDVLSEDAPREARREFEAAIAILEPLLANTPTKALRLRTVQTYDRLGRVAHALGDARGAVAQYDKALPIAEQVLRENPEDVRVRRFLTVLHAMRGAYRGHQEYFHLGDPAGAERDLLWSLQATKEAAARDPNDALAATDLALDHSRLSGIYELTRPEQALAELAACVAVIDGLLARDPKSFRAVRVRSNCLSYRGRSLLRMGRPREALPLAEESEREAARMLAQSPRDLGAIETRVNALYRTCLVLSELREWDAAEAKCKESLRLAEEQTAIRPEDLFFLRDAAEGNQTLARIALGRRDPAAARDRFQKSLDAWTRFSRIATTTVVHREAMAAIQKELAALPSR